MRLLPSAFWTQWLGERGFEADHVKPKRRYPDLAEEVSNLTWACARCNSIKSDDIDGIDPTSLVSLTLFNPNEECWVRHFSGHPDGKIRGMTATGRATGKRLKLNEELLLLELRAALYEVAWWPA